MSPFSPYRRRSNPSSSLSPRPKRRDPWSLLDPDDPDGLPDLDAAAHGSN